MLNFSKKNLLTVSFKVEPFENSKGSTIVVFVNSALNYDKNKKITMKMSVFELRVLGHACNEILARGSTIYKDFSNGSKSNKTSSNTVKSIFVNKADNGNFFINLNEGSLKIGNEFTYLELYSIVDGIKNFCDRCDSELFVLNS